ALAVHPGVHHVGGGGLAGGDVLGAGVGVAGRLDAVPRRVAVGRVVVEVALVGHVGAVLAGGQGELGVVAQGGAAVAGPLLVDQVEDLLLEVERAGLRGGAGHARLGRVHAAGGRRAG